MKSPEGLFLYLNSFTILQTILKTRLFKQRRNNVLEMMLLFFRVQFPWVQFVRVQSSKFYPPTITRFKNLRECKNQLAEQNLPFFQGPTTTTTIILRKSKTKGERGAAHTFPYITMTGKLGRAMVRTLIMRRDSDGLKGPVQRHCFATANMLCFPVIGYFW